MGHVQEQPAGAICESARALRDLLKEGQALDLEEESYIENHLVMLHLAYSAWKMEKSRTPCEKRAA